MMPVMSFVGNLGYVAVALVGSVLAVQGAITVGDIQAFIQYVKNFTQPITQLSQVGNVLQQMAAAAERIFAFLGEPELEPEQPKAKAATCPATWSSTTCTSATTPPSPYQGLLGEGCRRPDRGAGGPDGRGQNHHGEAAHALLRC